jgi:DNA polymerase-3 subunit delta'
VKHQERAIELLSAALRHGRMSHAYLFDGPEGVGKEMVARLLAATLLCERDARTALTGGCGECQHCVMVSAGTHPDVHLVERGLSRFSDDAAVRARRSADLSVEVVREYVVDKAGTQPFCGRVKLFIVRDAERMTTAAQNALLKTLEEPPGDAVLVLLTSDAGRLTPTTRSRCQRVPFAPLPAAFVEAWLADNESGLPPADAVFLARQAGGRIAAAIEAKAVGLAAQKRPLIALLAAGAPAAKVSAGVMEAAKTVSGELKSLHDDLSDTELLRASLRQLFAAIAGALDDVIRKAVGAGGEPIHADQADAILALSRRLSTETACEALDALARASGQLESNANAQLVVESLCNRLGGLMRAAVAA